MAVLVTTGRDLQGVVVLRGDGVEDGVAAFDEELQGGGEVGVDEGGDALAAGEAGAGVGDEELHHGRGSWRRSDGR